VQQQNCFQGISGLAMSADLKRSAIQRWMYNKIIRFHDISMFSFVCRLFTVLSVSPVLNLPVYAVETPRVLA
jgi:hypothetical protein